MGINDKTAALSNVLFRRSGIALSQPGETSFHHFVNFHEVVTTHLIIYQFDYRSEDLSP